MATRAPSVTHSATPRRRAPSSRADLFGLILTMIALRRQRRRLAELDATLLDDAGISRDAALAEARRPVWDVPPTWRL